MTQRSSGTKLVPPPRDFVPQSELALRHKNKNTIPQSYLENNSEEDDQIGMSQHRQGSGGAQQSSASQNPLYKVRALNSPETRLLN